MAVTVIRFGAMGDQIMLTPLFRGLAQRSGERIALVASGGWTRPLMESAPWVDEIVTLQSKKSPYWIRPDQWDLVAWLRQRPGPIWVCEEDDKTNYLLKKARIAPERLARYQGAGEQHACDRWLAAAALQPTGTEEWQPLAADTGAHTELIVDLAAQQDCSAWLRKHGWHERQLICLQAGNKKTMRRGDRTRASNVKHWPEERWAAVIDALLEAHPDAQVLLCGAPMEQELAQEIQGLVRGDQTRVAAVADQLPIPRLLALLARAWGCLSVDTGPAHAAAAVGCPITVLFGATDARLFRPRARSSPVEIVSAVPMAEVAPGRDAWAAVNTMDRITVADVLAGWQRMLSDGK
jgi:heptosyltransferase-2/heptosyltransferase-3